MKVVSLYKCHYDQNVKDFKDKSKMAKAVHNWEEIQDIRGTREDKIR